jgi:uncharacterized repeat protein (TIGR03803 family)
MKTSFLQALVIALLSVSHSFVFSQGDLWGVTSTGGSAGGGVLFKSNADGTGYQVKYNFISSSGINPAGGLIRATNGKLYGVTSNGGSSGIGVLFEYETQTDTYSNLFSFDNTNGAHPNGTLLLAGNGKLYGVTSSGGSSSAGVLFEYDITLNTLTKKIDFNLSNGSTPIGKLVETNSKLYGLTQAGGSSGTGVLFEYDFNLNVYTSKFNFGTGNGVSPKGNLTVGSNGKLYGTTTSGGLNDYGVLFEYDVSGNAFTKKQDFTATSGTAPMGGLIEFSSGLFYGLASLGGATNEGVLYQYDLSANTLAAKVNFQSAPTGSLPRGDLFLSASGLLYGASWIGGTGNTGTIFEYNPSSNTASVKTNLVGYNGINPVGSLIAAKILQAISFSPIVTKAVGDTPFTLSASASSGLAITYSSSNPGVATVSGNAVTIVGAGSTTITASQAGDNTYYPISQSQNFNVSQNAVASLRGEMWATTTWGGVDDGGVIFSTDESGNNFVARRSFTKANSNGGLANRLVEMNGKFYGASLNGSPYNNGALLFEVDPATSIYTKKTDLINITAVGPLSRGNNGKIYFLSSVFYSSLKLSEYDPVTNVVTTTLSMGSGNYSSVGLTAASNGKLYTLKTNKIVEINVAMSTVTDKATAPASLGLLNGTMVFATNGKFYGTSLGSDNTVYLFEYDLATGIVASKVSLGQYGATELLLASNGLIYGSSGQGGANGVLFSYDPITSVFTKLKDIPSGGFGAPIQSPSGKLYVATKEDYIIEYDIVSQVSSLKGGYRNSYLASAQNGKVYGGTQTKIFDIDPTTGTIENLVDFSVAPDGVVPAEAMGNLVQGVNGNFYGCTTQGGAANIGVLFEYNPFSGAYTKKYDFILPGYPDSGLIAASNGKLYGLTSSQSEQLYEYNPATGQYTKLLDIPIAMGFRCYSSILQASNGKLYIPFGSGGSNSSGSLVEYDISTNTIVKKYDFLSNESGVPSQLIEMNGKLWGTSPSGGGSPSGFGYIYEFNLSTNTYARRFDFISITTHGGQPYGGLASDSGGKLYGLTTLGGVDNRGIVYEFNPATYSVIKKLEFSNSTGIPYSTFVVGTNGRLYGTTAESMPNATPHYGTLFEYNSSTNVMNSKATFTGLNGARPFRTLALLRKTDQVIIFNPLITKNYGDNPFALTATASSGLPITYISSNPAVATISGSTVTILSPGVTTITARQIGNSTYNVAPDAVQILRVLLAAPTVASSMTFSPKYSTQMQINYVAGNGVKRLVVMKKGSAVDFVPVKDAVYTLGAAGGGNTIIANDASTGQYITGLDALGQYYFSIFDYNQNGNLVTYKIPAANFTTTMLALPDVPVITPANNAINQNVTLNVTAKTLSGATTYTLELNTLPDFTGTSFIKSGAKTQNFSGLTYSTIYYARVKTDLSPDYSPVTSFTTGPPEFFAYVTSPANAATNVNDNLTVTSNTVIGAITYTIELNTAADFTGISLVKSGTASQVFNNLAVATTYYTRVKTDLSPNWGPVKSFTTGDAPTLSYITTPANNATNQLWSLNLISNAVTGATIYTIQLSPVSDFSSGVVQNNASGTTVPISGLAYSTYYYVRVSTDLSPGVWGPTRNFTTGYPSNFSYITSPANGAVNIARAVNLISAVVKDATSYTIEANTASDFTGTSIVNSGASNTLSFSLDYATTYYVHVKTNLVPEWGPTRSFTTATAIANSYVTSPSNAATNQSPSPNVVANPIYNATAYTIQLSPTSDFSSGITELSSPSNTINFPSLSYFTTYYSRVTTDRSPGQWGAVRNFKTIDHYMTSPANGATNVNWVTSITVGAISGATLYTIEANTLPDFTGTSIVKSGSSTTQSFTLNYDQLYYVRAKSNLASGWGTTIRSFTTGNPVSFAYVVTPADGATNIATTVSVTANTVTGATSYTIELNTSSDFTGTSIVKTSASRVISFPGLVQNTTYYSRVQTNLAPGQWGAIKSFSTVNPGGRIASDNKQAEVTEEETTEINEIVIYPNPSNNEFSIQLPAPATEATPVKLTDQLGKEVSRFSFHIGEQNKTISTSDLLTGLYILQVETGGKNSYKKVMVVHE